MDEYNKYKNRNENHKKRNSMANKVSFYVSLAICVTAIGLAVWSTYTSYSEYKEKQQIIDNTSATQVNNAVTGVTVTKTTVPPTSQTNTVTETTLTETTQPTTTRPAETSTTSPQTSTTMSAVETMLQVPGSLIYPLEDAKVSKGYSKDAVYSKTMGDYRSHLGLDFSCTKNSKVLAMADGIVSDIYDDDRMGKVLIEDCGSFMIYYSGLDKVKYKINDSLSQKDVIGNVGTIPSESKDGIHLHVSVRVNGNYVDPLSVISNNE
ncbi:MAG: M23 family metallopeptidase [Ruminococcus sp.]|nr:M23 family metallopeptidase [Ruminococcus sp.]